MGGRSHPKLNILGRPIAKKYSDGKVKRTLKRRSKVLETVKRETDGASNYPMGIQTIHSCGASQWFNRSTECTVRLLLGCYKRYLVCMFVNIKYERGINHGGRWTGHVW